MSGIKLRIRYWLLDLAHDDGPAALRPGRWHKHHDLLERIAYSRWLDPTP